MIAYTFGVTNKPTEPEFAQTGDTMNLRVFAGFGLAAVDAGLGIIFWKKKKTAQKHK